MNREELIKEASKFIKQKYIDDARSEKLAKFYSLVDWREAAEMAVDFYISLTSHETQEEKSCDIIKHQLEYSIHSRRVSWCPICKKHFYNHTNIEHTTEATKEHYHVLTPKL